MNDLLSNLTKANFFIIYNFLIIVKICKNEIFSVIITVPVDLLSKLNKYVNNLKLTFE